MLDRHEDIDPSLPSLQVSRKATILDGFSEGFVQGVANGGDGMRLNNWFRQCIGGSDSQRIRLSRSASGNRQRIILRPRLFELLEDRALLAGLSGLHNIGPTGDFTSITAAIASIQTNGLDGALTLELQPSYVSTVEVFPLVFSNLGTTVVNTITLRPEVGATNLSITSADTTAATVDLHGAQYVSIDGLPGPAA